MKYTVLITDLDGTLLNSEHKITERTKSELSRIQDLGVKIVLASGRPWSSMKPIIEELALPGVHIAFGGAGIFDAFSNDVSTSSCLTPELVTDCFEMARSNNVTAVAVTAFGNFAMDINDDIHYMMTYGDPRPTIINDHSLLTKYQTLQILFVSYKQDEKHELFYQILKAKHGDKVNLHRSALYYIEMLSKRASKGLALQSILTQMSVGMDKVVGIGDSENDMSFLELVEYSIAMANADEIVKLNADMVTTSNDQEGVANAIKTIWPHDLQ